MAWVGKPDGVDDDVMVGRETHLGAAESRLISNRSWSVMTKGSRLLTELTASIMVTCLRCRFWVCLHRVQYIEMKWEQ